MANDVSIQDLWNSTVPVGRVFQPNKLSGLPEGARRYLQHAIAPGAKLASAVRLHMHGEIKLRGWRPFTAEEVIHRDRGLIWAASVSMYGIPIRGSDRLLDGDGAMRWKLAGIIPVMTASGPDITRSAIGRFQGEAAWLPTLLCGDQVRWKAQDMLHPHCCFSFRGELADLEFSLDENGRVTALKLPRWGNPDGAVYHYVDFGLDSEEEKTFDGYTVPTRVRAGWYFGTDRFESDGEFFRATIDRAEYR